MKIKQKPSSFSRGVLEFILTCLFLLSLPMLIFPSQLWHETGVSTSPVSWHSGLSLLPTNSTQSVPLAMINPDQQDPPLFLSSIQILLLQLFSCWVLTSFKMSANRLPISLSRLANTNMENHFCTLDTRATWEFLFPSDGEDNRVNPYQIKFFPPFPEPQVDKTFLALRARIHGHRQCTLG